VQLTAGAVFAGALACVALACGGGAGKALDELALVRTHWTTNAQAWIAFVERGFAAYDRRDATNAAALLGQAREKGCTDPLVLFRLAFVTDRLGKGAEATALYRSIVEPLKAAYPAHPYNSEVWHNLGHIEFRAGRFTNALELYQKALAAGSTSAEIKYSLGMACRRLARWTEAASWLEKADPEDFRVNFYLAGVYYELKKLDLAISRMKEAVRLDAKSAKAWGSLGHFYYALSERGEEEQRIADARAAILQSVACYKKAVANRGEMYDEYLKAALSRVKDLERLEKAEKSNG